MSSWGLTLEAKVANLKKQRQLGTQITLSGTCWTCPTLRLAALLLSGSKKVKGKQGTLMIKREGTYSTAGKEVRFRSKELSWAEKALFSWWFREGPEVVLDNLSLPAFTWQHQFWKFLADYFPPKYRKSLPSICWYIFPSCEEGTTFFYFL